MAFLKLATLVAVLATASAECQNCDSEELGLLQAKNQEQQSRGITAQAADDRVELQAIWMIMGQ